VCQTMYDLETSTMKWCGLELNCCTTMRMVYSCDNCIAFKLSYKKSYLGFDIIPVYV